MSEAVQPLLLILHLVSTLLMVGIIWFVQWVHYPLFARVGESAFIDYSVRHQQRTSWVVVPPMVTEAATALLLLLVADQDLGALRTGGVLLAVIWLSTFFVQVPRHRQLVLGFSEDVISSLVRSNWIRTVCWTGRAVIATWLVWRHISL